MHPLTVVRNWKELGYFCCAPNHISFLPRWSPWFWFSSELIKTLFEFGGFERVGSNDNQIYRVSLEQIHEALLIFFVLHFLVSLCGSSSFSALVACCLRIHAQSVSKLICIRTLIFSAKFSDSRRQQTNEILVRHQLTIPIHNSNCDYIIVGVDLVHESSHDVESFSIFDQFRFNLFALFSRDFFDWFVSALFRILRDKGPSHEQIFVNLFAAANYKCFSLVFDFIPQFFLDFTHQELVYKDVDNLFSHDVPWICGFLNHVQIIKEFFKVFQLFFFHLDFDRDLTCLFTLQNFKIHIALGSQISQRHILDKLYSVTQIEQI